MVPPERGAGGGRAAVPAAARGAARADAPRRGAAHWGDALRKARRVAPVADGDGDGDADARAALSAQWAANTAYVYRLAEGLVKETIARVASKASNGKVDARDLKTEDLELIEMYQKAASTWQEVCLVLRTSADAPAVATRAVVLNRPLAKGMDENLARLILNGDAPKGAAARYDDAFVQKFVRAFEGRRRCTSAARASRGRAAR